MQYNEYLKLKKQQCEISKKIEEYESNQEISLKYIKMRVLAFFDEKYPDKIKNPSFSYKMNQNKYRSIIVEFTFNKNSNFRKCFDFKRREDVEIVINTIIEEIDESMTRIMLYEKLLTDFESVIFQNQYNTILCKNHKKYHSLIVKIDLPTYTLKFSRNYTINSDHTLPVTHSITLDPVRVCGNLALSLYEELQLELNKIKQLKLQMR